MPKCPPGKWLFVAYLLMAARKGISALQLKHELSVSYPTAWYMFHRLRLGCGIRMEAPYGAAEVDETYMGGKGEIKHEFKKVRQARGAVDKAPVTTIKQCGRRVVAEHIDRTDSATLVSFLDGNVAPGAKECVHGRIIGL